MRPALLIRLIEPIGNLHPELFGRRIDRFSETLHSIAESPARLWGAVAGALAVQLLIVIFYLCIAWAIDAPLPPLAGFFIVPVSLVLLMAPVSVNGFGVREAIFAWFFARLGLPTDAGIALSLLSTATIMLFSLSGGIVWIVRRKHPPTRRARDHRDRIGSPRGLLVTRPGRAHRAGPRARAARGRGPYT